MALTVSFFSIPPNSTPNSFCYLKRNCFNFLQLPKPTLRSRRICREMKSSAAAAMFTDNVLVSDIIAGGLSGGIALSLLKLWEQTAKRGIFDQKLNRKLVHITLGLAFMLCWPMFSSGRQGAIFAALIPGINIIKMLLLGLGIWRDEATVKSMSRDGDYRCVKCHGNNLLQNAGTRKCLMSVQEKNHLSLGMNWELLKGPLYYASTITLASAIYWRTSPIAIAAVCNMCAGDGMADVVGRRFGGKKLPYNQNKSVGGSIAMATSGFLVSIGYMLYFSSYGFMEESMKMVFGFLIVSIIAALVESHPLSSELDDNLTVPLTAVLIGSFIF